MKLEKLDNDLKNYKSNSIKVRCCTCPADHHLQESTTTTCRTAPPDHHLQESIRRGHDDLGDHFLDSGDLANALKCYRWPDHSYPTMVTLPMVTRGL